MALLTGSRVYGTPNEDSDMDLVVLLTQEEIDLLQREFGEDDSTESYKSGTLRQSFIAWLFGRPKAAPSVKKPLLNLAIRFGPLNLIATSDPEAYAIWKSGTETLKAQKPVTRVAAVHLFTTLREARKQ